MAENPLATLSLDDRLLAMAPPEAAPSLDERLLSMGAPPAEVAQPSLDDRLLAMKPSAPGGGSVAGAGSLDESLLGMATPGLAAGQAAGDALAQAQQPYPAHDALMAWADGADYYQPPLEKAAPNLVAALAGAALPGSPLLAGLGGAALGLGARAAGAWLSGEDVGAAANPLNHKLETLFEFGAPYAINAVARGLSALSVAELPGYGRAVSGDAALPPGGAEPLMGPQPETPPLTVSRAAQDLGRVGNVGAALADPSRYAGGELLTGFRRMRDQIQGQGEQALGAVFDGLSGADRTAMGRIMSGVSNEVPTLRVAHAIADLNQWSSEIGGRAEQIPGMLTRGADGDTYGFRMLDRTDGGHYYPRINATPQDEVLVEDALARPNRYVDTMAHQRAPGGPAPAIVLDAQDAFHRYLGDMSTNMAASHYFGARPGFRWGEAADQAYMNMLRGGQFKDAKVFSEAMDSALNPVAATSVDRAARVATQAAGRVALGLSPLSHVKNIGNAVMRFGPADVIEGTTRYLSDPALATLNTASGAQTGGLGQMVERAGIGPRSLVSRGTQVVQDALRGVGNAGAAPYLEDLVRQAQSGTIDRAGLRQLAELGIDPAEAANGMTADLMSRGMKAAADVNMLQGHAVDHAAALFRNPLGRVLAQFQQYPAAAMHMASDAVLRPLGSGLRNMDASEIGLGLGRAARWGPAVAAPAAATELIKAAMNGRMTRPDWNPLADLIASTSTGIAGLPADVIVNTARRGDPGFDSPALGLLDDASRSALRIASGRAPGRGLAELLADLGAASDPSGTMAILRAPIRGAARGD